MKKKIAVLGGGMSAIGSIYELLRADNFQQNYDITVYQMGWRIGGKGASGRNADAAQRIEEHGLHMWFGMYNNAFNLIQDCYKRLDRPAGAPLATWQDAFKPHNRLVATDWFDNKWHFEEVALPTNGGVPGEPQESSPIEDYIEAGIQMLVHRFTSSSFFINHPSRKKGCFGAFVRKNEVAEIDQIHADLQQISAHFTAHKGGIHNESIGELTKLTDWIGKFLIWLKNEIGDWMSHDAETRCLFVVLDAGLSTLIGIIEDHVLYNGFDSINQYDLCEWLTKHGASPITTSSALIRGAYNAMFAYTHGDDSLPNMEAGTSLKAALTAFTIKGAPFWKMQAGMGDTIFSPLYEVLKRNGVKFKFFHKVTNVGLSDDKQQVGTITLGKQVNLKSEEYDPLVNVLDLPCWPSEPLYDQIVEGEQLQAEGINLESFWTPWKDVETVTLQQGVDFDEVILGISIASLPHICGELLAQNPALQAMTDNVTTTQTQAFQLWMKENVTDLGWKYKAGIMGAYAQPMDTWAGMDQLLDKEDWPADNAPKNVSYWCGPMKDADVIPPPTDPTFPAKMKAIAYANTQNYIANDLQAQWPNSFTSAGFDYNKLVTVNDAGTGEERLQQQFFRANIDPSERYVLTVKGSSKFRLKTDQSGFSNLYMTGDWIDNGFNFGCIEACSMAAILTARAISGKDIPMIGESIFSHP